MNTRLWINMDLGFIFFTTLTVACLTTETQILFLKMKKKTRQTIYFRLFSKCHKYVCFEVNISVFWITSSKQLQCFEILKLPNIYFICGTPVMWQTSPSSDQIWDIAQHTTSPTWPHRSHAYLGTISAKTCYRNFFVVYRIPLMFSDCFRENFPSVLS